MRRAIIQRFLWEAWFSLACGRKAAFKGDTNYAMGSVFRAVCSWLQVLYAVNNRYLMNEKWVMKRVCSFQIKPEDLESRVKSIYRLLASGNAEEVYRISDELHSEIEGLAGESVLTKIR